MKRVRLSRRRGLGRNGLQGKGSNPCGGGGSKYRVCIGYRSVRFSFADSLSFVTWLLVSRLCSLVVAVC